MASAICNRVVMTLVIENCNGDISGPFGSARGTVCKITRHFQVERVQQHAS